MIRLFLIMLVCAFVTASCDDGTHRLLPDGIYNLANHRPDSALAVLKRLEPDMKGASKDERMFYRLMCVKAADKVGLMHPDVDGIKEVVSHFASGGNALYKAEALYYAGRTYRTVNDAPQAQEYMLKAVDALDCLDTHDAGYLRGKCYSQLGSIFIYQNLYGEAATMYKKALAQNAAIKDTLTMLFNMRDIAHAYYCMNRTDSCMAYAKAALATATSRGDGDMEKELKCLLAGAATAAGRYAEAWSVLAPMLADTAGVAQAVASIAADLSNATGDDASCERYCNVLLRGGNVFDRQKATRLLSEIYARRGDTGQALEYMKEYAAWSDSANAERRTEALVKMNALYEYKIREQENIALRAERGAYRMRFGIAVACCLLVVAVLVVMAKYSRQQQQLLKMKLYRLESQRKEAESKSKETRAEECRSIESSDIYKRIRMTVNAPDTGHSLGDSEWEELERTVEGVYPKFRQRLVELCKINVQELRVSLLVKVGMAPSAIAMLTHHSKESVTATRRRLFEKAFGRKGSPKDWDDFILSL